MKLEDQVVSLELSKRLHELGVKQESLFYHQYNENPKSHIIRMYGALETIDGYFYDYKYSAFTASELLKLLPHVLRIKNKNNHILRMTKNEVHYGDIYTGEYLGRFNIDTFVNCLAKLLANLIENNLLEVK